METPFLLLAAEAKRLSTSDGGRGSALHDGRVGPTGSSSPIPCPAAGTCDRFVSQLLMHADVVWNSKSGAIKGLTTSIPD